MFLNLADQYATRLRAAIQQVPATPGVPLAAADAAALPAAVQRHLQRSGTIGKLPVRSFHIVYDAVMSQRPGQAGLPGPAEQFNVVQPVRRLFFVSDDRAQAQRDGTLKCLRWSTPMHDRREFQGRRLPTRGEAIWHQPEGPFVYGRFSVRSIRFDEAA